jgi:hypothetical protein
MGFFQLARSSGEQGFFFFFAQEQLLAFRVTKFHLNDNNFSPPRCARILAGGGCNSQKRALASLTLHVIAPKLAMCDEPRTSPPTGLDDNPCCKLFLALEKRSVYSTDISGATFLREEAELFLGQPHHSSYSQQVPSTRPDVSMELTA